MPQCSLLMQWTAPTIGIAMCPTVTTLKEWRESAYDVVDGSHHRHRDVPIGRHFGEVVRVCLWLQAAVPSRI